MHRRFSSLLGHSIHAEDTDEHVGAVVGICIDPDTGRVEGFHVLIPGFLQLKTLFLSSADVLRYGTSVHIASGDRIAPISDWIRLEHLEYTLRTVYRQRMVTESGRTLGRVADVQFNTDTSMLEWIFPRRFFRYGTPLPVSEIVEVTDAAVVVKDQIRVEGEPIHDEADVFDIVSELTEKPAEAFVGGES